MLSAKLLRLRRWMQRIGKQQQSRSGPVLFRGQNAGLPPSVGMPSEEDRTRHKAVQGCDRVTESRAVGRCVGRRGWPIGSPLAEGKVASKHRETGRTGSFCRFHQQWSRTVTAGAVRDYQTFAGWRIRPMEEAAYTTFVESCGAGHEI
jgi:hypothetical protein